MPTTAGRHEWVNQEAAQFCGCFIARISRIVAEGKEEYLHNSARNLGQVEKNCVLKLQSTLLAKMYIQLSSGDYSERD